MADFVAVLKKTLDGLSDTSPQMRERVYEKARLTIASKLGAMNPPPPAAIVDRQKRALEDAIAQVERDYAPKPPASDPLAELDDVFASLKSPTTSREPTRPSRPEPARPEPARPEPPRAERPQVEKAPIVEKATPVERPAPDRPAADKPLIVERPATIQRPPAPAVAEIPESSPPPFGPPQPEQARHIPTGEAVDALFADVPDDEDDHDPTADYPVRKQRRRRGGTMRLLVAAVLVGAVAATAYGVWVNRDVVDGRVQEFLARVGLTGDAPAPAPADAVQIDPPAEPTDEETAGSAVPEPAEEEVDLAAVAPENGQPTVQKFTQRLNSDGTETDAGPAGGEPVLGEGTSIATVSEPPLASFEGSAAEPPPSAANADTLPGADAGTPPDANGEDVAAADVPPEAEPAPEAVSGEPAPDTLAATEPPVETPEEAVDEAPVAEAADEAAPAQEAPTAAAVDTSSIPVAQRAIFYEERTNVADASAEPGTTVWSIVQESPGDNLPAEPAIRAETSIPGKEVQMRMTIRRNADKSLPASHIIEMIFITPDGFEGGAIDNVLRVSLKSSEQEAGSPLLGIPAKIADGFFLIALNDTKPEIDANMSLLGRQAWIDIPIQYKNGRRALFTMEKGIPGTKAFEEALKAWQAASG